MLHVLGLVCSCTIRAARAALPGRVAVAPAVVALAGLGARAHADVKRVDPYYVVVAKPRENLRCADGPIYYPVGEVKAGDVLRVDGEGQGWLRVEYLPGMKAYVPASEGTFDEGAKSVKLSKGSVLMAANATGARPWWTLLEKDAELPAGTTFAGATPVKTPDGTVEGYLVAAPPKARGFIRADATRKATPEESATYTGATPPKVASASPPSPPAAAPPPAGTTAAAKPDAARVVPVQPSGAEPTPAEIPGTTVVMPSGRTPADAAPGTASAAAGSTPGAAPEVTRRVDDLSLLREMFDRVVSGNQGEGELQTVISEFSRKIDSLGSSGDEGRMKAGLQQRVDALRLRMEIIQTRQRIDNLGNIDDRLRQIKVALEEVEKQAIYTIVGRMLPSSVYDGQRGMPLMYRVESADVSSTRTVGYVVPREGIDLMTKLGKVVGIVGEARFDPALNLNIVAPTRIDEFRLSPGGRLEVIPPEGSTGVTPATPSGQPIQPRGPGAQGGAGQPRPAEALPGGTPGPDRNK